MKSVRLLLATAAAALVVGAVSAMSGLGAVAHVAPNSAALSGAPAVRVEAVAVTDPCKTADTSEDTAEKTADTKEAGLEKAAKLSKAADKIEDADEKAKAKAADKDEKAKLKACEATRKKAPKTA
jgi:hypothetical protein